MLPLRLSFDTLRSYFDDKNASDTLNKLSQYDLVCLPWYNHVCRAHVVALNERYSELEFQAAGKAYYLIVRPVYEIMAGHWLPTRGENTRMRPAVETIIERAQDAVENPERYLEGSKAIVPGWSLSDQAGWSAAMQSDSERVVEIGMRIAMWTVVRDYLMSLPQSGKDEKDPTRNETVDYLSGKPFSGVPNAVDIAYPEIESGDLAELMFLTRRDLDDEAPLFSAGMEGFVRVFARREEQFLAVTDCDTPAEFEQLAKATSTTVNENDGSERPLSRTKYRLKLAPHMNISTAGILAALQENKTVQWVLEKSEKDREAILNTASAQMSMLLKRLREDDKKVDVERIAYKRAKVDAAKKTKRRSTKGKGRKRKRQAESEDDTDDDEPEQSTSKPAEPVQRNLRPRKQQRQLVLGHGMLKLPEQASSDESQTDHDEDWRRSDAE